MEFSIKKGTEIIDLDFDGPAYKLFGRNFVLRELEKKLVFEIDLTYNYSHQGATAGIYDVTTVENNINWLNGFTIRDKAILNRVISIFENNDFGTRKFYVNLIFKNQPIELESEINQNSNKLEFKLKKE